MGRGNIRGAKAEREWYRQQDVQSCTVCGRLFVRRKDTVCSMSCKAKAEQEG
jgi:hypothetical protein